jgi:hypothetical protein
MADSQKSFETLYGRFVNSNEFIQSLDAYKEVETD